MPTKKQANTISREDLVYLAGIFDSTTGLRSTNKTSAVGIAKAQGWPNFMAKKYGGTVDYFEAKSGKGYYGWFVDLERRLELLRFLKTDDLIQSMNQKDIQETEAKLERAISNAKAANA